jgi:hypothetical protein
VGQLDPDTLARPTDGARNVHGRVRLPRDSLDNAIALARGNFVFFNGTNIFL